MFRKIETKDKELFINLLKEFYSSPAVMHTVPEENFFITFDLIQNNSPAIDGFIIEHDNLAVGYGLVMFVYSNECGGMVAWLEELYIRPKFRGIGLGRQFFRFVQEKYKDKVKRFRLEVDPENVDAKRLYYKLGYEDIPYQPMYMENQ